MKYTFLFILTICVKLIVAKWVYQPGLVYNPVFPQNYPARNLTYPTYPYPRPPNNTAPFPLSYKPPFINGYFMRKKRAVYPTNYCIPDHPQCNGSHSLSMGCISYTDKILLRQLYKSGAFGSRKITIKYPSDFLPPNYRTNETITAIRIQDQFCNGTGGYATISSGGVGYNFVSIVLSANGWFRSFSFYVQLFGR